MAATTPAYVVQEAGKELVLQDVPLPPLEEDGVEVEIEYCGLCHTDIHMKNNDWGVSDFPMVPGHEGVGRITAVGSKVKQLHIGDYVGIGWIRDSCRSCEKCLEGYDNLCSAGYQGTYLGPSAGIWGRQKTSMGGCFARVIRIHERFAFRLPLLLAGDKRAAAAPLMCAGITVWEPIMQYVKPGVKVGVVGIGGLGSMALQLASAVGAEVFALSHSEDKKERVLNELKAQHFVYTADPAQLAALTGGLGVIIDTRPVSGEKVEDLSWLMALLCQGGNYCRVGIPAGTTFTYGWIPLIFTGKSISGSIVSGSAHTHKMLDVASAHSVLPDVEVRPFSQVNECMQELLEGGNTHFRYVLKWE
eukprot:CAMPEP_0177643346 /NCGR_PEP_ID=MMETSP0447-20121125/8107_1 /TAXON_ID=0 /ORGANISM="Stygamoeba regulata, Strain BSH-02190019" /LENGTH=359 /DNA_ID=CAMNT_0019145637 /DNA_START=57 /DNA_END=1136 /DNA_ORIENTATION=-